MLQIQAVNRYLWEFNAVRHSVMTLFSDAISHTSYTIVLYMRNGLQVGLTLCSDCRIGGRGSGRQHQLL